MHAAAAAPSPDALVEPDSSIGETVRVTGILFCKMNTGSLLKVNVTVDLDSSWAGALEIVKLVRPDWSSKDISHKVQQYAKCFMKYWCM